MKSFLLVVFACLTFVPGAHGQYQWKEVTPKADSGYTYFFTSVDCSGEVCTAVGFRQKFLRNEAVCFRSIDGGDTWVVQYPGLPQGELDNAAVLAQVQQIDSLNAIAATDDSGTVVRTTDGGNTWTRADLPAPDSLGTFYFGNLHFSDPLTGIATRVADYYNIYTTSDGGSQWSRSLWSPWLPATMCHSDGGEQFRVITYENGPLYYTSDNWNTADSTSIIFTFGENNPSDTGIIGGCVFKGRDTIVGYGYHWSDSTPSMRYPLIMTSMDNGLHWSSIKGAYGLTEEVNCISSLDRDIVFAGGLMDGREILVSADHGMSWRADTLAYPFDTILREISSVAVTADNHGVAIMGQEPEVVGESIVATFGEPKLMLGEPVSKVSTLPTSDSSVEIYPNPSSQSISITSAEAGKPVQVIDVLGRDVLQGAVPPSGTLTLDVSQLSPGIYYVSDGQTRARFVKE